MKGILITPAESGQRFDKYLFKYFNTAPKSFIYKMLRKKRIKLNGKKADGSQLLSAGDHVGLYLAAETMGQFMQARAVRPAGKVDVLYEDGNVLLINKPAGVLSHSRHKDDKDTLIERALFYLREKDEWDSSAGSTFTPSLCNRLDRNTSGIVICGKNLGAVQEMNRIIESRAVDKYYLAVVNGEMGHEGVLRGNHVKDERANLVSIREGQGGKEAVTAYERLCSAPAKGSNGVISLLRVRLITGRSHQIRAHFHAFGHSVLGDPKYGDTAVNQWLRERYGIRSQLLHSEKIVFGETGGILGYMEGKAFTCPLQGGFRTLVEECFPQYAKRWLRG